jgi:uncharacterized protein (TIGR03118 family)
MNKIKPTISRTLVSSFLIATAFLFTLGCKKTYEAPSAQQQDELQGAKVKTVKKAGHFDQVNLVANNDEYGAAHIDPTLINAWGLAFSSGGTPWVSSQAGHVADIYDREGVPLAFSPVHIPSPGGNEGGNPTGVVFSSSTTDFMIPGGAARFIFVGVDGVISAWNGTLGNHAHKVAAIPGSSFTGLTLASMGGSNFLYAANFSMRRIDVWDANWNPVSLPFADPRIPAGYAPFNIQNIEGWLFVTYAKVGEDGESEAGMGNGFVDVYNSSGVLVRKFASRGNLNAPWGVAVAPASFFVGENSEIHDHLSGSLKAVLVGNFGDGKINAFSTDGKILGQLKSDHGPVTIEGLWAIMFPPSTSTINPNRLYFTAGPDEETHGLFGYLIAQQEDEN